MNEFSKYHPIINFTYFLAVIVFSMIFINPITLFISLFSGFTYSLILNGRKSLKSNLLLMLPLVIITALINPLFNHEGQTILAYFPNGNPLTFEAIAYGISAAVMLWSVICHFSCFNKIMTSDKLVYLFGRLAPGLSLILSMVLRFVPEFRQRLKQISSSQKGIGKDVSQGKITDRIKNGIKILSVLIAQSLENAIDTADSMKSRGYGSAKRTAYSNFSLDKRNIITLIYLLMLSAYIAFGGIMNVFYYKFFPSICNKEITSYSISVFCAYLLLFTLPIIIEVREEIKWKKLKLKI